MGLNFLEGNEAIALGALKAGCNFFASYPITPASSIFNTMIKFLPQKGGICIQAEDEIASIGFCLGASMSGHKSMTATSGPGISLYSEHISFAIGSEIPIVIIDVQRLGPSTGSATLGAEGDIQFLQWGNSGGLPVIVLSPTNVIDCYTMTFEAFNISEEYRCPVFIASNKELSATRESVNINDIKLPKIKNRKIHNKDIPFYPFKTKTDELVPKFLPIGNSKKIVRQTSSTHGIEGYITTSSKEINFFQKRLKNKIINFSNNFTFYEAYIEKNSENLIITYGITAKSAKSIYIEQKKNGNPISLLILKTLWPVPKKIIKKIAKNFKKIIIPEMNLGLYKLEIERIIKNKKIISIGHMDGQLIDPKEIKKEL